MSESKPPRHPLFDPASTYSRMRKSVRPEYKMRGYFHWQKSRAIRLGIPLPEREPENEESRQYELRILACRLAGVFGCVCSLAVLPDGRLASGGFDDTVRVWDLDKNESLTLQGHQGIVDALAVLPDGRLASGSHDGTVRVWDLDKNESLTLQGHQGSVRALAVLRDGRLASGSHDGTVRVWNLHENESRTLQGHQGIVDALAVLRDGRLASGSHDGTVRVWDLHENESRTLQGHQGIVDALAVLPDGRLASGSHDGTVRVWDLHENESRTLQGHQGIVDALAVLPDGRLASGGIDLTVRVWDLHKNESLILRGHQNRVFALTVLPDGRLASGSADGTVRVWDLASGTCRIVGEHGPDLRVTDTVRPVCLPAGGLGFLERIGGSEPYGEKRVGGSLVLVREADGTRTVGMWMWMRLDEPENRLPVSCRAFLIEPEVLARLKEVVQQSCAVGPDEALVHAFAAETVAGNLDVARLLSAIPDLDGEVRGETIHFHRLPIASEFETFPPRQGRLTVALVCDDPAS